jgi:hypothetical protein
MCGLELVVQQGIALGREVHVRDRVGVVVVLAGGVDHQVRFEVLEDRQDQVFSMTCKNPLSEVPAAGAC